MSEAAAKAFDISQEDLLKFLALKKPADILKPGIDISDHSQQVILIISIFLFVLAIVTCSCTLCLWYISKKRRDGYHDLNKHPEKAEVACNKDVLDGSINGNPNLPQLSENKPKLLPNISFPEKQPFDEDELQKIKMENLEVNVNYYVYRQRLQANVRRVNLSGIDDKLSQNAYIYLVVSLLPEKAAFFESELRPAAEGNYFEESSEFDVAAVDIPSRKLKIAIFACDRFSQHRLVNQITYGLNVNLDEDEEDKPSIVPVEMSVLEKSEDEKIAAKLEQVGEVLFSLCYMPTSGRLTFVALKGRNINNDKETPIATYLRVSLLVSGKTMKTVQTSSVRRSSNPVYNEAFVFHTPLERIKDTDITVSVMTYGDNSSVLKMLGKIIVGPESDNNLGRKHWEAMLTSPRKPVAQWHSLNEGL